MSAKRKTKKATKKRLAEQVGNVSVPIYTLKRTGGNYYQIADHTTGRRVLRSFGQLAKAKKEAKRIAGLLASGQVPASRFSAGDRPTVDQEFELYQDGGPIGHVIIHPSGDPTVVFNHAIQFAAGEILSVIGPTVPDPHMARIRFNFVGYLD